MQTNLIRTLTSCQFSYTISSAYVITAFWSRAPSRIGITINLKVSFENLKFFFIVAGSQFHNSIFLEDFWTFCFHAAKVLKFTFVDHHVYICLCAYFAEVVSTCQRDKVFCWFIKVADFALHLLFIAGLVWCWNCCFVIDGCLISLSPLFQRYISGKVINLIINRRMVLSAFTAYSAFFVTFQFKYS